MWNPPSALTPEEQQIAQRTQKARKFFVFLRERRHALLEAACQETLAKTDSPDPGGTAPVETGMLALATLLQAYCHVGERDAVARTVMDKRWQRVRDCLGAEQPPCRRGTLFHLRLRLIAHNLDKTLLERTVTLAEPTGGCGARPLRAALASTPLCGAGRVEDTFHLLGHALRQAVDVAAQELGTSPETMVGDAGLVLVGHRSLNAALDLDGGTPTAREHALRLGLEEVAGWTRGLEPPQRLSAPEPPMQEVMDPMDQSVAPDTAPDPAGGPGGRRRTPHVAPDRRLSIEDQDRRHGRKSRAKTCHGFTEHLAMALESQGTREVVVRPANEPEPEAVEWLAMALERGQGLLQLAIDRGDMASPRMAQWAEQGVPIMARPWPPGGAWCTKAQCTMDVAPRRVTCPTGQTLPLRVGRDVHFPARACDACPVRAQCTTAPLGQGRSRSSRADEPFQQQLRTKRKTQRGRASLRQRTAVEHTLSHPLAQQGRRAR